MLLVMSMFLPLNNEHDWLNSLVHPWDATVGEKREKEKNKENKRISKGKMRGHRQTSHKRTSK